MNPGPGAGLVLGAHGLQPRCKLGCAINTRLVLSLRSQVVDQHAVPAPNGAAGTSETP